MQYGYNDIVKSMQQHHRHTTICSVRGMPGASANLHRGAGTPLLPAPERWPPAPVACSALRAESGAVSSKAPTYAVVQRSAATQLAQTTSTRRCVKTMVQHHHAVGSWQNQNTQAHRSSVLEKSNGRGPTMHSFRAQLASAFDYSLRSPSYSSTSSAQFVGPPVAGRGTSSGACSEHDKGLMLLSGYDWQRACAAPPGFFSCQVGERATCACPPPRALWRWQRPRALTWGCHDAVCYRSKARGGKETGCCSRDLELAPCPEAIERLDRSLWQVRQTLPGL